MTERPTLVLGVVECKPHVVEVVELAFESDVDAPE
jgi:hypothetical protein